VARLCRLACFILLACTAAVTAQAQQAPAQKSSVTVALSSVDELNRDLEWLFQLANDPKAFKTLKETLEVFSIGVTPDQPIAAQIKIRNGQVKTILSVPVNDPNGFLENIRTLGVKTKRLAPGLYRTSDVTDGYLRLAGGTAVFAEDRADAVGQIPPPAQLAAFLKSQNFDAGAHLINDPAELAQRRDDMQALEKETLAAIKQRKGEDDDVFKLRKLAVEQQLNELQRMYVEAREIMLGWVTSVEQKHGALNVTLSALPETSLAQSIALIGQTPSYFAAYKVDTNAPLSGVINFPLDEMRKEHLANWLKASRPVAKKEIAESTTIAAGDKERAQKIADTVYNLLDYSVSQGVFDGFIDVQPAEGGLYTALGGMKVDGSIVVNGLKEIGGEGTQIAFEKQGDFELHSVQLPSTRLEMQQLFGKETTLYLATSADAVWYAIGPGALERLRSAPESLSKGEAAASTTALAFHIKFSPWLQAIDQRLTRDKKGDAAARQRALAAFKPGGDTMDFALYRENDVVKLQMVVHEGVLRFVGQVMAKFVSENL